MPTSRPPTTWPRQASTPDRRASSRGANENRIRVEPRQNRGSTFSIAFPCEGGGELSSDPSLVNRVEVLGAVLDQTDAAALVISLDRRILFVNRRWRDQFDRPTDELIDCSIHDVFPADVAATFDTSVEDIATSAASDTIEELAPRDDGIHTFETKRFPIRDGHGMVNAVGFLSIDITERKRVEDASRVQADRLERVLDLDGAIRNLHSATEIAELGLRHLMSLVSCRRASVSEFNEHTTLEIAVVGDEAGIPAGSTFPRVHAHRDDELAHGQLRQIVVGTPGGLPPSVEESYLAHGITYSVNIPLLVNGMLVGLVNLGFANAADADAKALDLACDIAGPMAVAIFGERLVSDLEERTARLTKSVSELERTQADLQEHARRLEALHQLDALLRNAQSVDEIAETALNHIIGFLPCQRASVALEENNELVLIAVVGELGDAPAGSRFPYLPFMDIDRFRTGDVVRLTNDFDHIVPAIREVFERQGVRHLTHVPLVVAGELIGMINIATRFPDDVTDDALEWVRELAGPLAIAIAERRLVDDLENRTIELEASLGELANTEAELRRHAERLAFLRQLDEAIRGAGSAEEVADVALAMLTRNMKFQRASIAELDAETMRILGVAGDDRVAPARTVYPRIPDASIDELKRGQTREMIDDFSLVPEFYAARLRENGTRHIVNIPLHVGGELNGLITLSSSVLNTISPETIELAQEFAGPLAIAIAERRLVSQLEQRAAELQRSLDDLRDAQSKQWALLARLGAAEEDERRRIATEVHEGPMHALTALALRLDLAAKRMGGPDDRMALSDLAREVNEVGAQLRMLTFELEPPVAQQDIAGSLRRFGEVEFHDKGVKFEVTSSVTRRPSNAAALVISTIAREAIVNCRRHASGCTNVTVSITDDQSGHTVVVRDDGCGFDVTAVESQTPVKHGLTSIAERARLAGGWCNIASSVGHGTTMTAFIPHAS